MKHIHRRSICVLLAILLTAAFTLPVFAENEQTGEQASNVSSGVDENKTEEIESKETEPKETESKETEPKETESKETEPKETESKETEPKETEPKETEPKETEPKETEPKETATPTETTETTTTAVPTVTKHPTAEAVSEGGSAMFVARTKDMDVDKVEWVIVGADKVEYTIDTISSKYSGMKATVNNTENNGQYQSVLTLSGIPLSFSGGTVQAIFTNAGGDAKTSVATISVSRKTLSAPSINIHPHGGEFELGKTVTLSVTASDLNNSTLNYQWYEAARAVAFAGKAISGATASSFTPSISEAGTYYYYVEVWGTKNGLTSDKATSTCAQVIVTAPKVETTAAPTTETTVPVSTEETISFTPEVVQPQTAAKKTNTGTIVLILIILLLLLMIATVGLLLVLKINDFDSIEELFEKLFGKNRWECACGTVNHGPFCKECGLPKPGTEAPAPKSAAVYPPVKKPTAVRPSAPVTPPEPIYPERETEVPFIEPMTAAPAAEAPMGKFQAGNRTAHAAQPEQPEQPEFACPLCGWKPGNVPELPERCPVCGASLEDAESLLSDTPAEAAEDTPTSSTDFCSRF